ncbi:NADH:ubiquinone oxidoreductase, A subunit [gamma proteobacterium HTCC5015]|nr:NADH:ubiquinone oxidoreductase, A subunit [gamma proteobacterium HTCC5015]
MRIKTKKGLDLPIAGAPEQIVHDGPEIKTVAVLGPDYIGMKPTMFVKEGDTVKKGQTLFEDKKTPGVLYTAPAAGTVSAINRGARRALLSVVIEVDGSEQESFKSWKREDLEVLGNEQVREQLVKSGLWPALRTRPFSKVPALDAKPSSIFVTAIDTRPLAADPAVVAEGQMDSFEDGLNVLARITPNPIYVCQKPGAGFPGGDLETVQIAEFEGPHPAGLPGTHIHHIDPVGPTKSVWQIDYQDVIAIGKLFTTGELDSSRVVSVAGPMVKKPRLVRTVLGASVTDLTDHDVVEGDTRLVSGSVLQGHAAQGELAFLGRYHSQVCALEEDRERLMLHYVRPGLDKKSVLNVLFSSLNKSRLFNMTTTTNGSARAMVPVGYYERLMPLDVLPTQLLRAVITIDTDLAQQLGALELDEEDLSLCTFVTSSKADYGPALRECLTKIEIEG